jgi:hypothetical protein
MHCTPALVVLFAAAALAQAPPTTNLQAVPFTAVKVDDVFFAPRRAINRKITLEHSLKQLEVTGTLANFDLAAAGKRQGFKGYVFQDSDAYKAIESVAFALADAPDAELDGKVDAIIARIGASQRPDGYLNSWYSVNAPEKHFTNLRDDHELYCAGHLFEAAAAHFRATGKKNLLDIATKYADLLCKTFGDGAGKRPGYCGHPESELALVKLADVTGKQEYFELAKYFVQHRGSKFFATEHGDDVKTYDGTYWLDHVPICDMNAIAGHAVRATYLMSGAVDVAARSGDNGLLAMTRRVWRNAMEKNVFITGGIGPSGSNEGFTHDYDLPTFSAYQESCASIAVAMWAQRMALLYADSKYADAMETALYNAIPAGVQLDGTRFFYVNPLASRGNHHRREWFGCACCPPNIARTLAAVGGYAYATGKDGLYVNLYMQGSVKTAVGGEPLELAVKTDYPWDGKVEVKIARAPAQPTKLFFRVPAWSRIKYEAAVAEQEMTKGRYLSLLGSWKPGDTIRLQFDLDVRRVEADPRVEALAGLVAFARGPIVYCAEQVDQTVPVEQLAVPPGTTLVPERHQDLLEDVVVLTGPAIAAPAAAWTEKQLYRNQRPQQATKVTLVPYAVWDNRQAGPMAVWLPQAPAAPTVGGPEKAAKVTMSFVNWNCDPEGVHDGEEPKRSGDNPPRNCHWWNHAGTTEWVQYTWDAPQRLAGTRVFWFDDTGHGGCRLPKNARLLWLDGGDWKPVSAAAPLPIAIDRWCDAQFEPVTTTALRLEVDMQKNFAAGVLEWRVLAAEDDR